MFRQSQVDKIAKAAQDVTQAVVRGDDKAHGAAMYRYRAAKLDASEAEQHAAQDKHIRTMLGR